MPFSNFMEDIVATLVDEILQDNKEHIENYTVYRDDVIVYVLNRVPPRYYTSERGILHGKLDIRYLIQEKVDLFYLVHDALEIVRTRRRSEIVTTAPSERKENDVRLPHIIGEVLEESTLLPIPEMTVTLEYNGTAAQMIKSDWKNPFITNKITKGYYHFWPFIEPEMLKKEKEIEFVLRFDHNKCDEKIVHILVEPTKNYDLVNSFRVPIVLISTDEDVSMNF